MIVRVVFLSLFLASGCASFSYDGLADRNLRDHDRVQSELGGLFGITDAETAHRNPSTTRAKNKYREKHSSCESCGVKNNIVNGNRNDVHHILPVHIRPDLASDPDNLITLCRMCHFMHGHRGSWYKFNPQIRRAAAELKIVGDYWRDLDNLIFNEEVNPR